MEKSNERGRERRGRRGGRWEEGEEGKGRRGEEEKERGRKVTEVSLHIQKTEDGLEKLGERRKREVRT